MPDRTAIALIALLLIVLTALPAAAQPPERVDVFVSFDSQANSARLSFMDPLSGLSTVATVESGHSFTLAEGYVLYEKTRTGAVMRVNPDGTLEPHPFIRRAVDTALLRWVSTQDGRGLAWTLASTGGASAAYVAWADGSDLRQLPLTPEPGTVLYPLALNHARTQFFYDVAHPLSADEEAAPYPVYHHLMLYDISGERISALPGEPACPCPAAVTADGRILARLEAPGGQGPFALHLWDLPTGADIRVPAPTLGYRYAGDLVLNAIGTLGVYSVAAGVAAEASLLPESYALILADVSAGQQRVLLAPEPERYRPLRFIDEDSAVLVTHVEDGGTYKLELASGTLQRVASALYLGAITPQDTR